jgi:hypothetical protein
MNKEIHFVTDREQQDNVDCHEERQCEPLIRNALLQPRVTESKRKQNVSCTECREDIVHLNKRVDYSFSLPVKCTQQRTRHPCNTDNISDTHNEVEQICHHDSSVRHNEDRRECKRNTYSVDSENARKQKRQRSTPEKERSLKRKHHERDGMNERAQKRRRYKATNDMEPNKHRRTNVPRSERRKMYNKRYYERKKNNMLQKQKLIIAKNIRNKYKRSSILRNTITMLQSIETYINRIYKGLVSKSLLEKKWQRNELYSGAFMLEILLFVI